MQVSDLEIGQKVYIDTDRGKIEGTYMGTVGEESIIGLNDEQQVELMSHKDAGFESAEIERNYYPESNNIKHLLYRVSDRKRKELSAWLGGYC